MNERYNTVQQKERTVSKLIRVLAIACLLLPLTGCGDKAGSDLLTIVKWDQEYTNNWAPNVGAALPRLSVKNTVGESQTFENLTGEKGLLIFFIRSTNW